MATPSIKLQTPAGNIYEYFIHPIGTTFNPVGGNYMFAQRGQNGWIIHYAGITNNLSVRFNNHDGLTAARRKGATHILARANENESARIAEEKEIIGWLKPSCNTHHI